MQKHNLQRTHKNKKSRQIGRAGQRGKTSGRGTKGQNARAGHKKRPEIRDFIKRIPKLRGRGVNGNTSIQSKPVAINLKTLNLRFKAGDTVSPETLVTLGIVSLVENTYPLVKILASGELDKKLTVSGCEVSASAKAAIEKAGGTVAK